MVYVGKFVHLLISGLKDCSIEDAKGYAIPYEADGLTVTKCGVSITSEHRNITHWRMTDVDGNIIDEQKF